MGKTIFSFPSVTYASKAKRILQKNGISADLVKLDSSKSKRGCTYGVEFSTENIFDAVRLLKENGMDYEVFPSR